MKVRLRGAGAYFDHMIGIWESRLCGRQIRTRAPRIDSKPLTVEFRNLRSEIIENIILSKSYFTADECTNLPGLCILYIIVYSVEDFPSYFFEVELLNIDGQP